MGTNFYVPGHTHDDSSEYHIGKRSAAGLFCWDCGLTLCKAGRGAVHDGVSEWYEKCPQCGQSPMKESLEESAPGRELGFNKTPPSGKIGVKGCASFTWARKVEDLKEIEDEYGEKYTREEFEAVLQECPIQFFEYGKEFC